MKRSNEAEWLKIVPPQCDLCSKTAVWRHPLGGQRCGKCPRPLVKKETPGPELDTAHYIGCGCEDCDDD